MIVDSHHVWVSRTVSVIWVSGFRAWLEVGYRKDIMHFPVAWYLQAVGKFPNTFENFERACTLDPKLMVGLRWQVISLMQTQIHFINFEEYGFVLSVIVTLCVHYSYVNCIGQPDSCTLISSVREAETSTSLQDNLFCSACPPNSGRGQTPASVKQRGDSPHQF